MASNNLINLICTASLAALLHSHGILADASRPFSTPIGTFQIPITSSYEAKFKSTVKQERDFSCGSAAVATILTYHYEYPVNEHDIFSHMYKNGDQRKITRDGFSLLDMKRFLEAQGFHADGFRLPLDKLAEIGVPAIILINDNGYRHFVVIKGVGKRYVLIGDPARGTRALARPRFDTMWNGIVFIIRNKKNIASRHFNRPEEWRVVAQAPIDTVISRSGVSNLLLNLPRPYEF